MLTPGSAHICPGRSFVADHIDAARRHFEHADLSFTPEDLAAGRAVYNYGTVLERSRDMFGASVFAKDESGTIFHTYST